MKAGDTFYTAWFDDEAGTVEIERYGCRVVRKGRAYLTAIHPWTWGKRSKKNGDFGWLDPVAAVWKRTVRIGGEDAREFGKTKRAALRNAIARERKNRVYFGKEPGVQADCDRAIEALSARLRRTK